MKSSFLPFLPLFLALFSTCSSQNASSRPEIVNIGGIFTFNSTIGRVANVAINAAIDDINSDPTILKGSKLVITSTDANCNGFLGIVEALQFMETDTVAIVGPQCSTIAHIISYVADELQVPLLSFATDPTLSSLQFPFFVRTAHSDYFQMSAIADLVYFYQWRQVTAIYTDDEYGRNGIAALDDELANRRCRVSYKARLPSGASNNELLDLLVSVALMESRVIVVHVNLKDSLAVFSLARHVQMMGSGYVWIATDWLSSLLDSRAPLPSDTMDSLQGVLTLRQHTPNSKLKSSLLSRWNSLTNKYNKNGGHVNINSYGLYVYDTVWTIARAIDSFFSAGGKITFSNDSRLHDEKGQNLHLEAMSIFDQGKLMLSKIKNTDFTGVTGQFKFDSNGDLIRPSYDIINIMGSGWRNIGFWSNFSGLSTVPPEILYNNKTNNLNLSLSPSLYDVIWPGETTEKPRGWVFPNNGKELRIGVPKRVSYREFVTEDKVAGTFKGYCIDVFTAAVALLPYPVPYRFMPFGDGKKNPNYTDLCNMVATNVFDAAIGDIVITMNRTQLVDFTQPFIDSGLVVLARVKRQKSNAWAFLQPFSLEMWCVTALFFLIIGVVIWVLEHRINEEFRGPPRQQIVTIFWFSLSTLFFAHRENTVSTLGRGVLIIWLFVVLIIQSSYTASLTSILTVQQLSSPIKGIESLIASDEPIGFQTGSFAENYMVEELGISRDRLRELTGPEEYAQALDAGPAHGGVVAVVDERAYVELFLSTECKYSIIGSEFTRSGWGFAFPRDSPLAVDMSTAILALSENGDLQKIHDKWLTRNLACSSNPNEAIEANQLHLDSFWGLFLICGLACLIALLVYLYIMFRQFLRDVTPDEDPSSASRSERSLKSFFSFADERLKDVKDRSVRKKKDNGSTSHGSNDIES